MVIHDRCHVRRFPVHDFDGNSLVGNADPVRLAVLPPGVIAVFLLVAAQRSFGCLLFLRRRIAANYVTHGVLQA